MPPHTTKRRTTTNLKTKNNQNCQKIKLYGSPTTKELKKKHSSRLVGGAEMSSQADRICSKAAAGRLGNVVAGGAGGPIFVSTKPGGTTGEQDRLCYPGFQRGKTKPQNL